MGQVKDKRGKLSGFLCTKHIYWEQALPPSYPRSQPHQQLSTISNLGKTTQMHGGYDIVHLSDIDRAMVFSQCKQIVYIPCLINHP